jgi:hypothetical protein
MSTEEVVQAVAEAIAAHAGNERELLEALLEEAEGWRIQLDDLDTQVGGHEDEA